MTVREIKRLSDDELKELAKEKGCHGNASADALKAQQEIVYRNGGCCIGRRYGYTPGTDDERLPTRGGWEWRPPRP